MEIRQGDVAVITGGAGGIGSGLADLLAKRGCALALADISQEALERAKQSLDFWAGRLLPFRPDTGPSLVHICLNRRIISFHIASKRE